MPSARSAPDVSLFSRLASIYRGPFQPK
jgi:hypothetical protein